MDPFNKIEDYTELICNQIRWQKAHETIKEEIENHIIDQKDAYVIDGLNEESALDMAIKDMGDPIIVGQQLDRTHRPKMEWSLLFLTCTLLLMGIMINFLLKAHTDIVPELYYFYMMLSNSAVALLIMTIAYFLDFSILGKYPKAIYIILNILFVVTLIFATSFGIRVNGAKFLIFIPLLGAVPLTDIFLLMYPIIYVCLLYHMRNSGYSGILLCFSLSFVSGFALFITVGDMANFIIHSTVCIVLLIYSIHMGLFRVNRKTALWLIAAPLILLTLLMLYIVLSNPYFNDRLHRLINPGADPYGSGFTVLVIRDIIGGAVFFGQGSLPERFGGIIYGWLPHLNSQYLITYLIHQLGFGPFFLLLMVLMVFFIRLLYLCLKQKNILAKMVGMAILLSLGFQTFFYISANLGFYFTTVSSLPFISCGGLPSVLNLFQVGILLSIFKKGNFSYKRQGFHPRGKRVEYIDGKLIIHLFHF